MEVGQTLYVTTREAWREWLTEHGDTAPEVWLVSYRKKTRKPSLAYDAARDRGEEFDRRLETLVRRTADGRQFGYGIEEFYVSEPDRE